MNDQISDELFVRVHQLVVAVLEDPSSAAGSELAALVKEDDSARELFVNYMHDTAGLHWHAMQLDAPTAEQIIGVDASQSAPSGRSFGRSGWMLALAASLLAAMALWQGLGPRLPAERSVANRGDESITDQPAVAPTQSVATLTRLIQARWADDSAGPAALSRLEIGEEIKLADGQVEIVFDSGVELLLSGRCEMTIVSPDRVVSSKGTYSAHVGELGKGFTIVTPTAEVVDLGTRFGVAIDPTGETEVAVFQGVVDLIGGVPTMDDPHKNIATKRLTQGEALRVDRSGHFERVVTISSDRYPIANMKQAKSRVAPIIAAVTDNIRSGESNKFYRIVRAGLRDDAEAFVDRFHQWNGLDTGGLPSFLVGADYVMPFNDDKFLTNLEVSVELARPAVLYVLFDNNMASPEWLTRDFIDTGIDVGLDQGPNKWHPELETGWGGGESIDNVFSVWKREVHEPSTIVLGSVDSPAMKERGFNMYGIAAAPLATEVLQ